MKQFGINLNSIDLIKKPALAKQILKTVQDGIFDFVQLHARTTPEFYEDISAEIRQQMKDIKAVIHAPFHLPQKYIGVNTSDNNAFENNIKFLEFSQKCADLLKSDIIILHPGIGDTEECVNETIRQINMIGDSRITIENVPYDPFGFIMHGGNPGNIRRIINETSSKFCFDFAHAVCAANALNRNVYDDFRIYNSLKPSLYHLSDGDFFVNFDAHFHLGLGNYDIEKFLRDFSDTDAMIVLETFNPNSDIIDPWLKDAEYLRKLKI